MNPPLDNSQLQVLKTAINADPLLASQPLNSDGYFFIAVQMNLPANPDFYTWKNQVSVIELMQNGFDWTRVDNLTVGKARIWEFMTATGILDFSRITVRAGIEACFSVEAGDMLTRQAIYNGAQRLATRAEKLYATGTGTPSDNHGIGPATLSTMGLLTSQEIENARTLP